MENRKDIYNLWVQYTTKVNGIPSSVKERIRNENSRMGDDVYVNLKWMIEKCWYFVARTDNFKWIETKLMKNLLKNKKWNYLLMYQGMHTFSSAHTKANYFHFFYKYFQCQMHIMFMYIIEQCFHVAQSFSNGKTVFFWSRGVMRKEKCFLANLMDYARFFTHHIVSSRKCSRSVFTTFMFENI